jgi:hypothetical protein
MNKIVMGLILIYSSNVLAIGAAVSAVVSSAGSGAAFYYANKNREERERQIAQVPKPTTVIIDSQVSLAIKILNENKK